MSHILLIDQIHNLCGAKGDKPLYILADLWDATDGALRQRMGRVGAQDVLAYSHDAWAEGFSGALSLYLDFINLFLILLRFFGGGDRRR